MSFQSNACLIHNLISLKYHQQFGNLEFGLGALEYVRRDLLYKKKKESWIISFNFLNGEDENIEKREYDFVLKP